MPSSKFPGFPPEKQTWDFPTILNGYVHELTGSEFKVLWYILRHTYGWQKLKDKISREQFKKGIKKKDGKWLDKGIGLSDAQITRALKALEEKGFIKRSGRLGKKQISWYQPKISGYKEMSNHYAHNEQPHSVKMSNPQSIPNKSIPNRTNIVRYNPQSLKLAKLLYELIKKENPSWYVKPNWDKWAEDIDKIVRIDGRTFEQIEFMINWVQQDDFWKQNILSPAKLRKQFNNLVIRAKSEQPKVAIIR